MHTLRGLDDALALRAALTQGNPRVAVVGAGFVGAEVAIRSAIAPSPLLLYAVGGDLGWRVQTRSRRREPV